MIKGKKIISALLIGTLCLGMSTQVGAAEIDDTKQKAEELQKQKEAAESEQKSLETQLMAIVSEMEDTKNQISQKEEELGQKEEELFEAQAQENDQYESMKKCIKYMYENGNTKFVDILCQSKDISEFLNNAEYISTISSYDREQLVAYQQIRKKVQEQQAALEEEYAKLEDLQNDLIAKQTNVESLKASKESEISSISGELEQTNQKLAELQAAAEEAARKQKEKEAAAAAAKKNNNSGSAGGAVVSGNGMFTHPCPGYSRISSTFGYRNAPLAGASTNHKGVDFAASTGTPIYAAAAGTVTSAGYSGKAGNLIIINHGNGLLTYYMHCNTIFVSAGQKVSKGQNIGQVGTTGNSTGPHLHFQVMNNGTPVNPMNYL